MTKETNNLKKERINETDTAANKKVSDDSNEKKEEKKNNTSETVETKTEPKKDLVRMVGYPIVIGAVGALGGMTIANKYGKNKKLFIIGGFLVGSIVGFTLYQKFKINK